MTKAALPGIVGSSIVHLKETASTNDWMHDYLSKNEPPEGFTVLADNQTAGKGQFGSSWESMPKQNLLFSIYLKPHFIQPDNQFLLARISALAVWDALHSEMPDVSIKWPNDVYIGDQKVCGILISNSLQGGRIQHAIVGIGLNVNQTDFDASLPNASSLARIKGEAQNRLDCFATLLSHMDKWYAICRSGDWDSIEAAYNARLYRKDRVGSFANTDGSIWQGIIRSVNTRGQLLVEDVSNGLSQAYDLKTIRYL